MTKAVTTKTYFIIWLITIVSFVLLTVSFSIFPDFFQKADIYNQIFGIVYLGNIFVGVVTFVLGLVSMLFKNKVDTNITQNNQVLKSDKQNKPKTFLLIVSFFVFILSLLFLFISNTSSFTKDTTQFSRLLILAFFAFVFLIFFISFLVSFPNKLIINKTA